MSTPDRVRVLIEPIVADLGLDLYDLELNGGSLRVAVDQPGGVGMDAIASLTRAISRALDEHDPISGHFTLEVSSPGLERALRTPAHYVGALDTAVTVKTVPGFGGGRRVVGTLRAADDDGIEIETGPAAGDRLRIGYGDIERARTVFEWGPTPKPGKAPRSPSSKAPRSPSGKSPSAKATKKAESKKSGSGSSITPPKAARAARPGASASPNEKVPAS